jgi:hypothetical protein
MEFPWFQMAYIGDGITIGFNAVVHVLISHGIAIGLVALIGLTALVGVRREEKHWEDLAHGMLLPSVVLVTGIGAVTGVGIWFSTSALVPAGIGSMLRIFFWPWFTEWIVFTLEVGAIIAYYFLWDGWTGARRKYRYYYGFAYAGLGTMSAVIITAILSFMLTSDAWPWNRKFWYAFLNPSFVPHLILRIMGSFVLGSMFALFITLFTKRPPEFRRDAVRLYGIVLFIAMLGLGVSTYWYFTTIPAFYKGHALLPTLPGGFTQAPEAFWIVDGIMAGFVVLLAVFALLRMVLLPRVLICFTTVFMFFFVAQFESMREFMRGPYLMPGYMYVNQILLKEHEYIQKTGLLANSYWFNYAVPAPNDMEKGAYIFIRNCGVCHTIDGTNSIKARLAGRTADSIDVILKHTKEMVPFMPPFSGTEEERKIFAHFLYQLKEGEVTVVAPYRYLPAQVKKRNESNQ